MLFSGFSSPLNSLFDSHCLRYKHQRPFKMLKLYSTTDLSIIRFIWLFS